MANAHTIQNHAAFIWSVADLLRGDYKQSEYGKVILPLTVLRRLDCVLEPTKQAVLDRHAQLGGKVENLEPVLQRTSGEQFYNTSKYDFGKLLAAPDDLADNLRALHRQLLRRRPGRARQVRLRHPDHPARPARTCCTSSCRSSPRSTSTPTRSRTWRWATSTRS